MCRVLLFLTILAASAAAVVVSSAGAKQPQTITSRGGSTGDIITRSSAKSSNRRWNALMENCIGCWSGTIGWYDVEIRRKNIGNEGEQYKYKLKPRPDNNKRNMRLSFQTRADDASTADWVVYHAKGQGVREEVVLRNTETNNNGDLPMQTFYSFEGGNLGRSGTNFMELPVIEHGFWDVASDGSGERRTVVLVYNPHNGHIMKVCYLQQKKKVGRAIEEFDVSGVERDDIGVMPKKTKISLSSIRQRWLFSPKSKYMEVLDVQKYRYKRDTQNNTLLSLFGSEECYNDGMLRLSLPNGVILACPISIKSNDDGKLKSFDIAMGCQTNNGEVQLIQFAFDQCKLKLIRGSVVEV